MRSRQQRGPVLNWNRAFLVPWTAGLVRKGGLGGSCRETVRHLAWLHRFPDRLGAERASPAPRHRCQATGAELCLPWLASDTVGRTVQAVIVDTRDVLLTSANMTNAAYDKNLELGVLCMTTANLI